MSGTQQIIKFTTPVGRLVWGSMVEGRDKDDKGQLYTYKVGPNAGNNFKKYDFGLAVPKDGRPWEQTEWGALIVAAANAFWPAGQHRQATFAWKVTDGDSTAVNKANKRPVDHEGYAGHWVLAFQGTQAPRVYEQANGQWVQHGNPGAVKRGYYIQVECIVTSNGSQQSPGLFLNHNMVAFRAYGPEIVSAEADPNAAGFGAAPLPAGASAVPLAASAPMPSAAPAPVAQMAPPVAAAAPPFQPHPAFLTPPVGAAAVPVAAVPPAPPPMPPAPPAAPVRVMLPAANGTTYEAFIAAGWTDALLVQHGMMAA